MGVLGSRKQKKVTVRMWNGVETQVMLMFTGGIFFFVLGALLATNLKGFTDSTFHFLASSQPTSRSARPGNLRVVGAGFLIIGAGLFVPEVFIFLAD